MKRHKVCVIGVMLSGLVMSGQPEPVISSLFEFGEAALNPLNAENPSIGHQGMIEDGAFTLKSVNQQKVAGNITTVLTDGDAANGYRKIELTHREAVQWNSWLEYQIPARYPASGATHKLVFETHYTMSTSDPSVALTHAVGFAARAAQSYGNAIFLPDRMSLPFSPTAAVAGQPMVARFEIEPSKGTGTVFLNDVQLAKVELAEPALGYLTASDLGFVRLYFKSGGPAGASDGAALGASQTFHIERIRAYIEGEPVVVRPSEQRVYFQVDQAFNNLEQPEQPAIANGGRIRHGTMELAANGGYSSVATELITPTSLGYHAIQMTVPVVSNGLSQLQIGYPHDYPAKGRGDPLVIEARLAVSGSEAQLHGLTLSARALSAGGEVVIPAGVFGILPRQIASSHSAWTNWRFEIRPAEGTALAYAGNTLVQTWELPEAEAALLRNHDLTDLRLHLHTGESGINGGGQALSQPVEFSFDRISIYQRSTIISAEDIATNFSANAPALGRPRVLVSAERLAAGAQLRFSDTVMSNMYAVVINTADNLSQKNTAGEWNTPPLPYGLDSANLRIPNLHAFHNPVGNLAVAYGMTGNERYAERIWAQVALMNEFPDWGITRHALDTGVAAANYGIAHDFLTDWLTEEQKDAMWVALRDKALIPARTQMRNRAWWHTSRQNWNAVIHGGLITAALSWFERDPELNSEVIALAANGMKAYIDEFYPDGQTVEGSLYWGYGLSYLSYGLEALQNVLGTDFGLSDSLGMERTRYYPMLVAGPVATINIGDDNIRSGVGETQTWIARRFEDGNLLRNLYERWSSGTSPSWRDMMWFHPDEMAETMAGPASTDTYLRGQELISLIQDWTDPNAVFVAIHGGENAASHGHLDAGSFYIQAAGTYFAFGNLGADDYTSPGFFTNNATPAYNATSGITTQGNQSRWHFYNTRAEGKNALVFKPRATPGDLRPDQDPNGYAIVKRIQSHDDESSAVLNLQSAYSRDVSRYERGIRLWNNRSVITVQDEFTVRGDSTVWWAMHTRAPVFILDGGRTARLFSSRGSLIARLRSPAGASFTSASAGYLPSESFPLTDNRQIPLGMRKLMIQLDVDGGKSQTIQVDFAMDSLGDVSDPWTTPLEFWGDQVAWPDFIDHTDFYSQSAWMGWVHLRPDGWLFSADAATWLYSRPNNSQEHFLGWSPTHEAWFWSAKDCWPWVYLFGDAPGWSLL